MSACAGLGPRAMKASPTRKVDAHVLQQQFDANRRPPTHVAMTRLT
jgi:hypothetical protein